MTSLQHGRYPAHVSRRLVDGLGLFSLGLGAAQMVAPGVMNRLVGAGDDARSRAVQRWLGGAREIAVGAGIESRWMPGMWLWGRVAGDVVDLGILGVVLTRRGRRPDARRRTAVAMAAVAGVAVADVVAALGVSRNGGRMDPAGGRRRGIAARAWVTINRPLAEVFAYWHDLENLPRFMAHLQSVESLGDGRSRWRAAGPAGVELVWDAEISDVRIDEFIAWRSVGKASVTHSGEVEFRAAPDGRGTEVRVRLSYDPPAGKLGAGVAKLFGAAPDQQLRDDLRRFKQVLETGEVVRSEGSPEGTKTSRQLLQRPAQPAAR
ncbi:MAG: hypothetical protein QOJ06_756 [Pseudonocardiales bacterium]|nr:hypothetical protein [Pseudonocardiales bacterium]